MSLLRHLKEQRTSPPLCGRCFEMPGEHAVPRFQAILPSFVTLQVPGQPLSLPPSLPPTIYPAIASGPFDTLKGAALSPLIPSSPSSVVPGRHPILSASGRGRGKPTSERGSEGVGRYSPLARASLFTHCDSGKPEPRFIKKVSNVRSESPQFIASSQSKQPSKASLDEMRQGIRSARREARGWMSSCHVPLSASLGHSAAAAA